MGRDFIGLQVFGQPNQYTPGVVLLDDFEGLFNWDASGTPGDYTIEIIDTKAFTGAHCALVETRTTSAAENDTATMARTCALSTAEYLRLITRWQPTSADAVSFVDFILTLYTGAKQAIGRIRCDVFNKKTYYLDAAAQFVEIAGITAIGEEAVWSLIDMSIDFHQLTFLKCSLEGIDLGLDDVPLYVTTSTSTRRANVEIRVTATDEAPGGAYVDKLLILDTPGY